jgi:hypothetical protein
LRNNNMSYAFSFTKKSLSLVLAGFAFVGIMLFTAGLLIGTTWKAEPNAPAHVISKQPVAAPAPQPSASPQEPVMTADVVTPEAAAPTETDGASGEASPARQAHGNAASVRSRRKQTPAPAPPNDDELRVIQEAEPSVNANRSGG